MKYYDIDLVDSGRGYTPKAYFIKYLPVEGEIKSGEKYWNKQWKQADVVGDGIHVAVLKHNNFQPAKLFLCSRDIQVGDMVRTHTNPDKEFKAGYAEVHRNGGGDFYKVIGEISPQAIWVKEGMEFDEGEVKATPYGEKIKEEKNPDGTYNVAYNWRLVQKIMCRNCKTFH